MTRRYHRFTLAERWHYGRILWRARLSGRWAQLCRVLGRDHRR